MGLRQISSEEKREKNNDFHGPDGGWCKEDTEWAALANSWRPAGKTWMSVDISINKNQRPDSTSQNYCCCSHVYSIDIIWKPRLKKKKRWGSEWNITVNCECTELTKFKLRPLGEVWAQLDIDFNCRMNVRATEKSLYIFFKLNFMASNLIPTI